MEHLIAQAHKEKILNQFHITKLAITERCEAQAIVQKSVHGVLSLDFIPAAIKKNAQKWRQLETTGLSLDIATTLDEFESMSIWALFLKYYNSPKQYLRVGDIQFDLFKHFRSQIAQQPQQLRGKYIRFANICIEIVNNNSVRRFTKPYLRFLHILVGHKLSTFTIWSKQYQFLCRYGYKDYGYAVRQELSTSIKNTILKCRSYADHQMSKVAIEREYTHFKFILQAKYKYFFTPITNAVGTYIEHITQNTVDTEYDIRFEDLQQLALNPTIESSCSFLIALCTRSYNTKPNTTFFYILFEKNPGWKIRVEINTILNRSLVMLEPVNDKDLLFHAMLIHKYIQVVLNNKSIPFVFQLLLPLYFTPLSEWWSKQWITALKNQGVQESTQPEIRNTSVVEDSKIAMATIDKIMADIKLYGDREDSRSIMQYKYEQLLEALHNIIDSSDTELHNFQHFATDRSLIHFGHPPSDTTTLPNLYAPAVHAGNLNSLSHTKAKLLSRIRTIKEEILESTGMLESKELLIEMQRIKEKLQQSLSMLRSVSDQIVSDKQLKADLDTGLTKSDFTIDIDEHVTIDSGNTNNVSNQKIQFILDPTQKRLQIIEEKIDVPSTAKTSSHSTLVSSTAHSITGAPDIPIAPSIANASGVHAAPPIPNAPGAPPTAPSIPNAPGAPPTAPAAQAQNDLYASIKASNRKRKKKAKTD